MSNIIRVHRRLGAVWVSLLVVTSAGGGCDSETSATKDESSTATIAETTNNGDTGDSPEAVGSAAAAPVAICDLYTEAEITEVIGLEVSSMKNYGPDNCEWHFPTTADGGQFLTITLSRDVMYTMHAKYMEEAKYDVDGLGDKAKFAYHGPEANSMESKLYVLQGDTALEVKLAGSGLDEAATREALTTFASDVLESR